MPGYEEAYRRSLEDPEGFWGEVAQDVRWDKRSTRVLDRSGAPLLKGCTTILYEGKPVGTPDPGAFWRVCAQHGVNALFTAPTAFRAIKRDDPGGEHMKRHDLSRLRTLFLAGERCDPDTLLWARERLAIPVIDHWWQTETGWAICGNPVGLTAFPVKPGSATKPMPGYDVRILDEDGREVPPDATGSIAIPVGFVVCKAGVQRPEEQLVRELVDRVRERIGPVAFFKIATVVKRLPKTRSGKILRGTMRRIAEAFLSLAPLKEAAWMMWVPLLSQALLLGDVLHGEYPPLHWLLSSAGGSLAASALFLRAAARLLRSERIVFGRG